MTYSKLKGKTVSGKFAFHINMLLKEGIVEKYGKKKYRLSKLGMQLLPYFDISSMSFRTQPLIVVTVLPFKGKQVLLNKRTKEPFLGYYSTPDKVIGKKEHIYSAAGDILDKIGLSSKKVELSGIIESSVIGDDDSHYIIFVFSAKDCDGKVKQLKLSSYEWVDSGNIENVRCIPDVNIMIDRIRGNKLFYTETSVMSKNRKYRVVDTKDRL